MTLFKHAFGHVIDHDLKRGDVIRSRRFPDNGHRMLVTAVSNKEIRTKNLDAWGSTGTLADPSEWEVAPVVELSLFDV